MHIIIKGEGGILARKVLAKGKQDKLALAPISVWPGRRSGFLEHAFWSKLQSSSGGNYLRLFDDSLKDGPRMYTLSVEPL